MKLKPFVSLLAFLFVAACIESGGSGSNFTTIPDVEIQCSIATCQTSGTATAYVGIISGDVDCQSLIQTLTSSNPFSMNFDAWGTGTIITDLGFQQAFITQWFDSNNAIIEQLDNGSYTMCGFYDTDGDEFLDMNEGFGETQTSLNVEGTFVFIDWAVN